MRTKIPRQRRPISRLNFARLNPFRRPDWRWLLAESIVTSRMRPTPAELTEVGAAVDFLRDHAAAHSKSDIRAFWTRHRLLCSALALRTGDEHARLQIEARLLARQPAEEIAQRLGTTEDVIHTFARFFFDLPPEGVGEDWIRNQVLGIGAWYTRRPTEAEIVKTLARSGGVHIVDLMLGDRHQHPDPDPVARHRLAERARFLVRDQATMMTTPIPTKQWIAEVEQLFAMSRRAADTPRGELRKLQFEFLKLCAGVPLSAGYRVKAKRRRRGEANESLAPDYSFTDFAEDVRSGGPSHVHV